MFNKLGRVFLLGGFSVIILLLFLNFLLKALPGGDLEWPSSVQNQIAKDFFSRSSFQFLLDILSGNFGFSISYPDHKVSSLMTDAFYSTLKLATPALVIVFSMAFVFSITGVIFRNSWIEKWIDELFIFFLSLPILFLAPLLIYIFSIRLDLLPLAYLNSFQSS